MRISIDFEHTNISEPNTALKSTYLKVHDGNCPSPGCFENGYTDDYSIDLKMEKVFYGKINILFTLTLLCQTFREINGFSKEFTEELISRNIFSVSVLYCLFFPLCLLFLLCDYCVGHIFLVKIPWKQRISIVKKSLKNWFDE